MLEKPFQQANAPPFLEVTCSDSEKKDKAARRRHLSPWVCCRAVLSADTIPRVTLSGLGDTQSHCVRGARQEFNPSKTLMAVWPIAGSLCACKSCQCYCLILPVELARL